MCVTVSLISELPLDIPLAHQRIWTTAFNDGRACAIANGYQEQNPYNLLHPLFDAWRSGWFEGLYSIPHRELLSRRVPKNLGSVLDKAWRNTLLRARSEL